MTLPKNALTTHPAARTARKVYRTRLRPVAQDTFASGRAGIPRDRGHLPDYLIVGVQKAGTTGLFESLMASPDFGRPLLKEVHYFDAFPSRSLDWYRSHFWGRDGLIWGEGSPEYFETPGVAEEIHDKLPEVKIVILLRDPVRRAVSHFHHSVDFGLENRSLEQALRSELESLDTGVWPAGRNVQEHGYLSRSRYSANVRRWLRLFPDRRVLVLVSERRTEAVAETLAFLGGRELRNANKPREANQRPYERPSEASLELVRSGVLDDLVDLRDVLGWAELPSEWAL